VRTIVLKRDKLKTQLAILRPRRGHALKNDQEQPALIPLIWIILAQNESGDIIKKCTEIYQISNNITEIYQRYNHKHKDTIIHNFY
jgi:hypothetical protein